MSTRLCIQVSSTTQPTKLKEEFLYNQEWTPDAEALLLQRIHDILSLVRNDCLSIQVSLDIAVKDPEQAIFLIRKNLHQASQPTIGNYTLSLREIEILGLIMQGYTNHQIADKLFISYETVRSHRKHILAKTGARNTAALINHYHQTFFEK